MQISQQNDAKKEGVENQSKKARNLVQETNNDEEQRLDVLQIVLYFFCVKMKFRLKWSSIVSLPLLFMDCK